MLTHRLVVLSSCEPIGLPGSQIVEM